MSSPFGWAIQYADLRHQPDPARAADRLQLGLLGQIASILCLIEVYSDMPSGDEFRACLAKHIAFWRQRTRKAQGGNRVVQDRIHGFRPRLSTRSCG